MKKKNMGKILVVLAALMIGFSAIATGADIELAKKSTIEGILKRGELRVGFESGYIPFEMTDKKGKFVGFDMDLAKEIAKAMGVKLKLINTAFDGVIPALNTGKFDMIISGMTITQERNLKVNFSDPYITVGQTILVAKKHEGIVTSYKNLNDPKYTVACRLGTTGEKAVRRYISKATIRSFETEAEGILEVINGNADAFVYDLPLCVVYMAQQGAEKLVFLDKPFTFEPLGIAINKGDPDFLNWLNNFMKQIKNDGRYDRMYNKWIKSTDWLKNVQQ
ncbi:amino acid ABC transporter substrate-binding pro tein [Desulfonema ishimotonii]|uniref:Amino acid ABC transporter substrate-binding pro tein n=1 Tax=Desulfonema ishimotonii TaxID=45657 RepID=A0A401FWQ3_9BACT|nr:transporter substrate-binding domain-containing protein [Desulfonema ishimotonii]GBC61432.1 amino acid ABC transporter substrate-binding pro tein [Desulfonema ishimotonii]